MVPKPWESEHAKKTLVKKEKPYVRKECRIPFEPIDMQLLFEGHAAKAKLERDQSAEPF